MTAELLNAMAESAMAASMGLPAVPADGTIEATAIKMALAPPSPPLVQKVARKRVLIDSDDEEEIPQSKPVESAPPVSAPAPTPAAADADAHSPKKRRKHKHKHGHKHKHKRSKLKKPTKLGSDEESAESGGGGKAAAEDSSEDDSGEEIAISCRTADNPKYDPIGDEEMHELLEDGELEAMERIVRSNLGIEGDDDEIAEEMKERLEAENAAEEAALEKELQEDGGANAEFDASDRPGAKLPFDCIMKPICQIEKEEDENVMLCAILCYVVEMDSETMVAQIRDHTGDEHSGTVRKHFEDATDSPHACESVVFFETLGALCAKKDEAGKSRPGFSENDVMRWRRSPGMRSGKKLRRMWLMCLAAQDRSSGDIRDYGCSIGAYRLVVRGVSTTLCGVNGGDLAAAACAYVAERRPLYASEKETIAKRRALCLTQHEIRLAEFNPRQLGDFIKRVTLNDAQLKSNVVLTCFGGFPVRQCAIANVKVMAVRASEGLAICEYLPKNFADTTAVKTMPASESTAAALAAANLKRLVQVLPVYNMQTIRNMMLGSYFHPAFFCLENHGEITVDLFEDANGIAGRAAKRGDGKVESNFEEPGCYNWCKNNPHLNAFRGAANSSASFVRRLRDSLVQAFSPISCGMPPTTNPVLVKRMVDNCYKKLYDPRNTSEDEIHLRGTRLLLLWFADLFIIDDKPLDVCSRAFGLSRAKLLARRGMTELVYEVLSTSNMPHAVFFGPLFNELRYLFTTSVDLCFLGWLRANRYDAYSTLLEMCNGDELLLPKVVKDISTAVTRLEVARLANERCAVIQVPFDDEKVTNAYLNLANVTESPVRIVRANTGTVFLVHANDYAVEVAARYLLLNASLQMRLGGRAAVANDPSAKVKHDARIVLLRGANAEDMVDLVKQEMEEDLRDVEIEEGGKVLIVVCDASDVSQARAAIGANGRCHVVSANQFCSHGSAGAKSGGENKAWSEIYCSVVFWGAHRFPYDQIFRVVCTLCGIQPVPSAPRRMTDDQRKEWQKQYINDTGAFPSVADQVKLEEDALFEMRDFCEKLVDVKAYDLVMEETPERVWGFMGGNKRYGIDSRFVFAYVAYARPDTAGANNLMPTGNFCEDVYFSNCSPSVVRVVERYDGGTAGQLLEKYYQERRAFFLKKTLDVTNALHYPAITNYLIELQRDAMRINCSEDMDTVSKQAAERERFSRVHQQTKLTFPVAKTSKLRAIGAKWHCIGEASLPAYTPGTMLARDVEQATQVMKFSASAVTREFVSKNADEFNRVRMVYAASGHRRAVDYTSTHLTNPNEYETENLQFLSPDIGGIGRAVVGELMARLRTDMAACVIFGDHAPNLCSQALIPSVCRASQPTTFEQVYQTTQNLRVDRSLAAEESVLRIVGVRRNNSLTAYYHCLQSAFAYTFAGFVDNSVMQYNEILAAEGMVVAPTDADLQPVPVDEDAEFERELRLEMGCSGSGSGGDDAEKAAREDDEEFLRNLMEEVGGLEAPPQAEAEAEVAAGAEIVNEEDDA